MNADEYLKLAEVEDEMWYFHSLHAHVRRELEARHAGRKALRVLDAGCGTGGLLLRLGAGFPSWRLAGIDFMPLACELARRRCPGCDVAEASVTALPFGDETFDAVACVDVLCQVPHPVEAERAALELARVLRPGGTLVINLPAYRWLWSYHDESCQTCHRFSRREVRFLLDRAGLRLERLTGWNALTFPLIVAKRKLFARPSDTSDVKPQPYLVDRSLRGVMAMEHAWLRLGGAWAWGSSVLAVASKPESVGRTSGIGDRG